jgi:hypothetical protein
VLPSGKRIPGLKLDHARQLALMHALVCFAHIAAGNTFTTAELYGNASAILIPRWESSTLTRKPGSISMPPPTPRVEERNQNTKPIEKPFEIAQRAEALLTHKESGWADLAVGLGVATGRRISDRAQIDYEKSKERQLRTFNNQLAREREKGGEAAEKNILTSY